MKGSFCIVVYLLRTRTVEAEKQPLLDNARTQKKRGDVTIRDVCSRCYGTIEKSVSA
jgi:hypothetical protein